MNKHGGRDARHLPRALATGVALTAILACTPEAHAADEQRLRDIENKLREVTEELEALKARESGEDEARKARQEAQEARERTEALEQRVNQMGIQARLGEGLIIEDPGQRWRLRMTGRALGDFRIFNPDVAAADTFSVRQARLGVNLTVLKDWGVYLEGEYAGTASNSNVILSNAYVDWQIVPAIRLRVGQFKPMFGLEHTDRVPYFDFTERALPQALIQNFLFDRGLSLMGSPTAGLYYGVSLTNGTGQNIDERQTNATEVRQDGKDVSLRLAFNLAQAVGWQDRIAQAGFSLKSGSQSNSTGNPYSAASLITEGRGLTFFTPQAFNASSGAPQVGEIDRRLVGFEAMLALGPVKFQAERISARYAGERLTAPLGGFDRKISGHYISALWLVTGEHYADAFRDAIVARIRPRNNFSLTDGGRGALELGVRYSAIDAGDFSADNGDFTGKPGTSSLVTTGATQASAFTVGLKWMPNAYVRYMLNWVQTRFDSPVVVGGESISSETSVVLRAQFDFF